MPEFAPSEAKLARAPITVQPSGLSCQAEVFLGPDDVTKVATSGLVPFTSTGASQDVHLPLIMPSTEGSYHVYIDVYAEGSLIVAYQALEDVVITTVAPPPEGPVLIYAQPAEPQVVSGGNLYINYKVGIPYTADKLIFLFPLEGVRCWTPYGCANANFKGKPAGYYEGSSVMYVKQMIDHFQFENIPPGVYRLLSTLEQYRNGTMVKRHWSNVDTGQIITVL